MENKIRLDTLLFSKGYCKSRTAAQSLIEKGHVSVNGKRAARSSETVREDAEIAIRQNEETKYVSRGGQKLEYALIAFELDVSGLIAADIGASTGGFTDVLLQKGAKKVYAIENGSGQLAEPLKTDDRVVSMEKTNARDLEEGFLPEPCDIAVMDVSFISQAYLYRSVRNLLRPGGHLVSLIKPQFEAGARYLNKRGVVKDEGVYQTVIASLTDSAARHGLRLLRSIESPVRGKEGNREFLALFLR